MREKIQLVVFNEMILGYKDPERNFLNILAASIRKGAGQFDYSGNLKYISSSDSVRLATEKDFEEFMVSIDGYKQDPKYEYDREN